MTIQKTSLNLGRHFRGVWFAFVASDPELKRVIQPYQLRDILAYLKIREALGPDRYQTWDVVINVPPANLKKSLSLQPAELHVPDKEEEPIFKPTDLIVITTRPPLNDEKDLVRKIVPRSETDLEKRVLNSLRPFFAHNKRNNIELSAHTATCLKPEKGDRRNIQYAETYEACYKKMGTNSILSPAKDTSLTAGYLVFRPHAWEGGPSLLCIFGLTGWETLNWATYLAMQRADWLRKVIDSDEDRFYMAEWSTTSYPRTSLSGSTYYMPGPLASEAVADLIAP